jgi:hypothetical protein
MSTQNAEGLKFRVVSTGNPTVDRRKPCKLRVLTQEKLQAWIESQQLDARVKQHLKLMAGQYPQQALEAWVKNYNYHLAKAQEKVQQENLSVYAPPQAVPVYAPPQAVEPTTETVKEERNVIHVSKEVELPQAPGDASEFDTDAWGQGIGEDQGGRAEVHPDVPNEGGSGSGPDRKHRSKRKE